jgi:putative chitobiose transport system substrate-binding protein
MMDEELIPKTSLTEGQGTIIQMYSGGEVAMFQGGTSHASMIEKNNKQIYDNTGVGQQLANANGKYNEAVMNICVSESSKNKDAAVKFSKFITDAPNQVEFAKVSGAIIPSTKDSIKDDFFNLAKGNASEKARTISAGQIEKAKNIFPPIKNYNEIQEAFLTAVQKSIAGDAKPEEALKEAEALANAALAK